MTHDLIALNFLQTQFSQTTNSSTSKHEVKELATIVMEDFLHFLQAAVVKNLFSGLFHDQEMLR